MFLNKYPLLIFALLCSLPCFGQQQVTQALYKHHFNLINPAVAGTQDGSYLNLTSRNQWASLDGAPRTNAISLGFPHGNNRAGWGISIVNDEFNVEKQTFVSADFSYRLQMNRNTSVYLGLKAGYNSYRLDLSNQKIYGLNGEIIDHSLANYSSILPNIGAGLFLKSQKSFLSISVPRLLNTERRKRQDGQQVTATDRPHLFVSAGTKFGVNDFISFHPSFLFSAVNGAPSQFTLDATFLFGNRIETGVQLSETYGFGGTAVVKLIDGWKLGYAYLAANGSKVNYATHEFVLKIKLKSAKPPVVD